MRPVLQPGLPPQGNRPPGLRALGTAQPGASAAAPVEAAAAAAAARKRSFADSATNGEAAARGGAVVAASASSAPPPAKRPNLAKAPAAAPAAPKADAPAAAPAGKTVTLTQEVAAKLTMLKGQGIKILAPAVRAVASAERQDALVVLQALAKRGATVADPTQWIITSLSKRGVAAGGEPADPAAGEAPPRPAPQQPRPLAARAPGMEAAANSAKAPVGKSPPAAKAPIGKNPPSLAKVPPGNVVAKAPVGKSFPAKAPLAKAPLAKAPPARERLPPKRREGLPFEQGLMQEKLFTLNKQQIWPGQHPLDESALAALLRIDPYKAMELLEEAQERGNAENLTDPSAFVRRAVALEEKAQAGGAPGNGSLGREA